MPLISGLTLAILDNAGNVVAMPKHFQDLSPFVAPVNNLQQALSLARLYTTYPDFLLFEDKLLEIELAGEAIQLPDSVTNALLPLRIDSKRTGQFHLARNLIKYDDRKRTLSAFRSDETIDRNGHYRLAIKRVYSTKGGELSIYLPE